ncbi:MAG TPA: SemiSWEET transporter [Stellaceae bacterium]
MSPFLVETVGVVAGVLTTLSFLPQVVKVLRERQTAGLSLRMYLMMTAGTFLWLVYGIAISSLGLVLANAITFLLSLTVLALKIRLG